ncbi:cell division control protein 48 homolog C-like isoform X2 [Rhododendron vialii]|uniref:cell division control protein 48 homolog C-like isoform X2 n=1 Tax=Rhododendron vialii TaxID=182163 RepID=UPI00265EE528|nr:cell division control protein 48 homolog C-like isoform X2 [Rhododendron vialii]
MKTGSRRRGGGGGSTPPTVFERVLRRHIESFKTNSNHATTLDDVVAHLRSSFPEYSRHKLQPFTRAVQQTLQHITSNNNHLTSTTHGRRASTSGLVTDDEQDNHDRSARKRTKRVDAKEERLRRLEEQHVRRKRRGDAVSSASGSDSTTEETDGNVSTSEDAVYGEEIEPPEFDLMKSMLRASYSGSKSKKKAGEDKVENNACTFSNSPRCAQADPEHPALPRKKRKGENNVELEEVFGNKAARKVDFLGGDGGGLGKTVGKGFSGGGGEVGEVKGKDGPRFKDLGGMRGIVEELKMEVIVPLYHPELPRWLGVRPMAGILLHGPPGCGKTRLAHAVANETGVPFYKISATELVSGVSGGSEENIRDLFAKAYRTAPSIVFIDEIDAIASKRENLQREMERRIVTQLMTCMDESHRFVQPADVDPNAESANIRPGYVLVIGATNRPDAVDPALRRPGRFDREIVLGVPDENARVEILSVLTRDLRVEGAFDLVKLARSTPGFVGADLTALANKAGNLAMKRIIDRRKSDLSVEPTDGEHTEDWWKLPWLPEEIEKLNITMADFEEAAKLVQPSLRREGFSSIPNVKWEDVGGLHLLRQEFDRYIVRRIKYPEDYEGFGVDLETGFLLYGPPGCGKTLIAKAVANEAGANFIHIKGPELLSKYVGESELAVRTIFSRARTCSPCILFFDEVDALTTKRGKEGGWVVERLLNQLLIELDGADQRQGVYVIGATNRPEVMDRAVLRPGRFGKLLFVPLPSPDERGLILKALARKKPIDSSVDLIAIGRDEACENLSGADLSALMNEAAMAALEEKLTAQSNSDATTSLTIGKIHFEQALKKVSPSVSEKQKHYYQLLTESFRAA